MPPFTLMLPSVEFYFSRPAICFANAFYKCGRINSEVKKNMGLLVKTERVIKYFCINRWQQFLLDFCFFLRCPFGISKPHTLTYTQAHRWKTQQIIGTERHHTAEITRETFFTEHRQGRLPPIRRVESSALSAKHRNLPTAAIGRWVEYISCDQPKQLQTDFWVAQIRVEFCLICSEIFRIYSVNCDSSFRGPLQAKEERTKIFGYIIVTHVSIINILSYNILMYVR